MKKVIFLRSTVINLSVLALILLGYNSVYGQTTSTQDIRRITFGIETAGGVVFSGGSTQSSWGRSLNFDIEANLRIPLGNDDKFLYFGLQGTSFRYSNIFTLKDKLWVDQPGIGGGSILSYEMNSIALCFTANVGLEQDLGWFKSRSTIGFGVLSGENIITNLRNLNYSIFATRLRQQFHRESGSFMYGIKFEQTLSNYDNFFSTGLVLGIRF